VQAIEKGASVTNILSDGAFAGHQDICQLAKDWGATNFNGMLLGATRGGHRALCELAISWGATDFEGMLLAAANSGHQDLCELAIFEGARGFTYMLANAAYGGHRDLCELAISEAKIYGYRWTTSDFDRMLTWAATRGFRDLCELAVSWGATNFNKMLEEATQSGRYDMCLLAISWAKARGKPLGVSDFENMLAIASRRDNVQLKQIAEYWRACAHDPTLPAWVSLYALLLVTDGEFQLSVEASPEHKRWVAMMTHLPLELQAVVCCRVHGVGGWKAAIVTGAKIDEGEKWFHAAR
jgi:hypothetical protein